MRSSRLRLVLIGLALVAMLSVWIYAFVRTRQAHQAAVNLGGELVPLVHALSQLDSHLLDQETTLERLIADHPATNVARTKAMGESKSEAISQKLFWTQGQKVRSEIRSAEAFAAAGAKKVRVIEDAAELARVQTVLGLVRRGHDEFENHAKELFHLREERADADPVDAAELRAAEARVTEESDRLEEDVEQLVFGFEAFTTRRGQRVEKDDMGFVFVVLQNAAFAIVMFALGMVVAAWLSHRARQVVARQSLPGL